MRLAERERKDHIQRKVGSGIHGHFGGTRRDHNRTGKSSRKLECTRERRKSSIVKVGK